jgi:hypothetical protein
VQDIATADGSKAAWFKDSEGNILALIQTVESAPATSSKRHQIR